VDPLLKTKINFWFRHIWEYWWPLYPGVILAMDITGLDPLIYMAALFPLSLCAILIGSVFLLSKIEKAETSVSKKYNDFFKPLLPIGILLAVYFLIQFAFPFIKETSRYLPMSLGILSAAIYQQLVRPLSFKEWRKILFSKKAFTMAGIVAVIRIYGAFIAAKAPGGDFLIAQLRTEMAQAGIPPLLLIIMLPFVASLTTGIAVGFVGASMPIVMQLIGEEPSTTQLVSTAVLAYGSGYIAMLISPVHVCLIVTNEHFKTSLFSSIRSMLPLALLLFGGVCLWAFLIRIIF
jgi:integral membrane protein (TIGR00529 family)